MRLRIWFALFILSLIIVIPLFRLGVDPIHIFINTFFIVFIGYSCWMLVKSKRLVDVLEEKCDPLAFLEKSDKFKMISKRVSFQNLCNVNISVGLISLGRYDESLKVLLEIETPAKGSKLFEAAYHLALLDNYLSLGDLDKAAAEYDCLKTLRKNVYNPRVAFAIDAGVAWYLYESNRTSETARYYLSQLEYLCGTYAKKMSKRQKLTVLYTRAVILESLGDFEEAAKKYKIVAEHGNHLYITKMSLLK